MPLNTSGFTQEMVPEHRQAIFPTRVKVGKPDECWPFLGRIGSHGYGMYWIGDRETTAHRVAFVLWKHSIPPGLVIDHDRRVCGDRRCCNPAHLRVLTNELNAKDNLNSIKSNCPQGHPYDQANTYIDPKGWRRCRTCAGARFGRGPTTPRRSAS